MKWVVKFSKGWNLSLSFSGTEVKGCFHYIVASLFCMSKREHFGNKEKCFLFHFENSSFWDNQILTFQIFKCCGVIRCLIMKHKTLFTE